MIRDRDRDGAITNKQTEWSKEDSIQYSATRNAFNGSYWECYLCHKEFSKENALNQHLNSPVHKRKVYRCPNAKTVCGKEFIALAGLFSHLESESCAYMRFEKFQQQVSDVIQGRRLITSI
jgi:hypothetical protein